MRRERFLCDTFGISVMYDAVLFIVMVSLSGVILLPAIRMPLASDSSLDAHREQFVDDALHTYLVSRPDVFEYRFAGTLIDDIAGHIGIDNTSDGLYGILTRWLLAHEQRHKTFATLLAENLGCQWLMPFSILGTNQLNIFTDDFDKQLRNETEIVLSTLIPDKYRYNLSAWWHPIKGIPLGGRFSMGPPVPGKDCYVARNVLMMPYAPWFTLGNHTVIFTKHWFTHQLFHDDVGFGRSSIPEIANMTIVFENYTNGYPPYDIKDHATKAIKENLSALVDGFLISGIVNESNVTVFPGIVTITLSYCFQKLLNVTSHALNQSLNELFGESVRSIDRLFYGLNSSQTHALSQSLLTQLTGAMGMLLNESFGSFADVLEIVESMIVEQISDLLRGTLDSLIDDFVNTLFNGMETIKKFAEHLVNWLFDRISLNKAEVLLTIWVVRE
jgi:hypothetical protein